MRKTRNPIRHPDHITVAANYTDDNGTTWEVGEYVWVKGWSRSKRARHRIHRILVRDTGHVDVQVWYEHRGYGQVRSVFPERLGKRRQSKVEVAA